jgi:hypothetical protein
VNGTATPQSRKVRGTKLGGRTVVADKQVLRTPAGLSDLNASQRLTNRERRLPQAAAFIRSISRKAKAAQCSSSTQ